MGQNPRRPRIGAGGGLSGSDRGNRTMARTRRMPRRTALKIGASAAALPFARIRAATAGTNRVLRYTHMGDISSLDPHWSALATVSAADNAQLERSSDVGADMLRQVGLNVDYQLLDRGTFAQRQYNKEPVEKGGWSCYFSGWWGVDVLNPAVHGHVRGNGTNGRPGWPTSPRLEDLREAWLDASDLAAQQRIATEIQAQVFTDLPRRSDRRSGRPSFPVLERPATGVMRNPSVPRPIGSRIKRSTPRPNLALACGNAGWRP